METINAKSYVFVTGGAGGIGSAIWRLLIMEYTYLKTKVKVIAMSELIALQNAYIEAEKNNQEWLMQSMAKVFDDIDIGKILIREDA